MRSWRARTEPDVPSRARPPTPRRERGGTAAAYRIALAGVILCYLRADFRAWGGERGEISALEVKGLARPSGRWSCATLSSWVSCACMRIFVALHPRDADAQATLMTKFGARAVAMRTAIGLASCATCMQEVHKTRRRRGGRTDGNSAATRVRPWRRAIGRRRPTEVAVARSGRGPPRPSSKTGGGKV